MNKVALITGSSRGIGKSIALGLAKNGYNIVITGKSTESSSNLPGNIYDTATEVEKYGVKALPFKIDHRYTHYNKDLFNSIEKEFGRLDVLINNAGALSWNMIEDTDEKKYDLINDINCKNSFFLSKDAIPLMKQNGGHIINQSPPLLFNNDLFKTLNGKTAYMISKWGMTLSALGIAEEYRGKGISANTIWPMTPIESYAVRNNQLGNEKMWRKSDIIVDSILEILREDSNKFTGNQLIDEIYLREKGVTNFEKYQCVPGYEPPKLSDLNFN